MLNYQLARTAFGIFLVICTFVIPLIVTAIPLMSIIRLSRLQQVQKSVWLLASSTVVSTGIGCLTTGLAVVICANTMGFGMSGDGAKCVTGAVIFVPIGILFTILAFGVGLYFTGELVVKNVNESARDDWY